MKKILMLPMFFVAVLLIATSCEDDDAYSLGKFWISYATVEKPSMGYYTVKLDNGNVLYPSYSNVSSGDLDDRMRILVDYTILQDAPENADCDYYVKINRASSILTKELITYKESISDSLGIDPIELQEPWIANGFITFEYLFGGGLIRHMVNLARHEELTPDGRVLLEFRHNAFNDPDNYSKEGVVSFKLKEAFPEATEPISLRIKYKAYDNEEKTFDLTYTP